MATVSQVDRKVAAALRRAGLANGNKTLVIGVSGGADSSTLLYSLNQLGKTCDIGLHVCHLNHDFRGEEADEDARFVESLARELGLPCTVEKRDPIAYQREQGISSFEQGAREMRYEFMSGVAHQVGATAVAVGHTSDDLAETILLHILRGAGLHGLRGMTELAPWPWPAGLETPVLFRPLLEVSKSQTVEYCRELGRAYRQDSGNLLFRFTRNRVRRELMPLLAEEYNPRVSDALVRLANSTSLDLDYLETELDRAWPGLLAAPSSLRHVSEDVPEVVLKRESLSNLHPALQRMALRRAYVTVKGDARRLSERHLISMMELAAGGKKPGTLDLPSQVALNVTAEEVAVSIRNKQDAKAQGGPESQFSLSLPVVAGAQRLVRAGDWKIEAEIVPRGQLSDLIPINGYEAYMDPAALGPSVIVRTRHPGDRFQPLGMDKEKKLQDFMVDAKVPREWRDRVPLVLAGGRIAWVVGYRIAEWAKVTEYSRPAHNIMRLTFVPVP